VKVKRLSLAIVCMLLTTMVSAEVANTLTAENDDRLYIESAVIHVEKQGIFLNLHEKVLPITGIARDERGVYVTVDSEAVNMITCRRCGMDYDADNQSSKCPHGWVLVR
jgi:hypothetical protein